MASEDHCENGYEAAASTNLENPQKLAGVTRSTSRQNSFTLLTPDARVYAAAPRGWQGQVSAAAVIAPALGARFSMYMVDVTGDARLSNPVTFPSAFDRLERFFYVLSGAIEVESETNSTTLHAGGFLYVAPHDETYSISSSSASLVQIDRIYEGVGGVVSSIGREQDLKEEKIKGEVFRLRRLLDPNNRGFDFNIHIMDFSPGKYLNVKEVHYNEHGLLMLRGHGIYRLDDKFLPVGTGDIIYMAPFVPQWYAALGSTPSRYFLYKDMNVDPLNL